MYYIFQCVPLWEIWLFLQGILHNRRDVVVCGVLTGLNKSCIKKFNFISLIKTNGNFDLNYVRNAFRNTSILPEH